MRERHAAAPRPAAWSALLDELPREGEDLSVEPPWRHVRRLPSPPGTLVETTVALRDDGDECHLAWAAGTSVEGDEGEELLDRLATEGEALLARVVAAVEGEGTHG